jgi:hypothetical protein
MKLSATVSVALAGLLIFVAAAVSQTPRGGGRDRRPGGLPPRFRLGSLFPPEIRTELKLTKEQETRIASLEAEVKSKLERILTADQKRRIETPTNPPGPEDDDHGRPVAQVAKELGVTPQQFRDAFKKVRPARAGEEPTHEQRQRNRKVLSEALGVSPERLDEVMDKYRPGGRGTNGPPPR